MAAGFGGPVCAWSLMFLCAGFLRESDKKKPKTCTPEFRDTRGAELHHMGEGRCVSLVLSIVKLTRTFEGTL